MLRLDKGFAGKGTSVAVRIIVADKETTGKQPPSTINRASISKLLEAIREIPPRSKVQPDPEPPVRPRTTKPTRPLVLSERPPPNSFPRPARPLPVSKLETEEATFEPQFPKPNPFSGLRLKKKKKQTAKTI